RARHSPWRRLLQPDNPLKCSRNAYGRDFPYLEPGRRLGNCAFVAALLVANNRFPLIRATLLAPQPSAVSVSGVAVAASGWPSPGLAKRRSVMRAALPVRPRR